MQSTLWNDICFIKFIKCDLSPYKSMIIMFIYNEVEKRRHQTEDNMIFKKFKI